MAMRERIDVPTMPRPQRKMRPNEPCWCGSGRKWKLCHRNREEGVPLDYFQATDRLRKLYSRKFCLHPQAPNGCGKIIAAHTLQRSGVLSKIAESGHVYSCKDGIHHLKETGGRILPARVGIKKASIFNGFCEPHDTALFRPIETGRLPLGEEATLLLALRAVSYEVYAKRASMEADQLLLNADVGRPFAEQVIIQRIAQARIAGTTAGLRNIEEIKSKLDRAYLSGAWDQVKMYAVEFDSGLPIVSTGAFCPVRDFAGVELQSLLEVGPDCLIFALTYSGERSVVVFAWTDCVTGAAERFVGSFASLPDADKATAVGVLAVAHLENTHFRPSWWEELNATAQAGVGGLLGMGGLGPAQDLVLDKAPFRIEAAVQSVISNVPELAGGGR